MSTRRPLFADGDEGLASTMEAAPGFSGPGHFISHPHHFFLSRSAVSRLPGSIRSTGASLSSSGFGGVTAGYGCSSPRLSRAYDSRFEELNHAPHFLEACFLCKKPLGGNRDIFMYRGDTPFCSEECRQEQIDRDEVKEKRRNLSASVKAMRRSNKNDSSSHRSPSSSPKSQDYPYRPGTTVAAA